MAWSRDPRRRSYCSYWATFNVKARHRLNVCTLDDGTERCGGGEGEERGGRKAEEEKAAGVCVGFDSRPKETQSPSSERSPDGSGWQDSGFDT